jgi:hypothetical protein
MDPIAPSAEGQAAEKENSNPKVGYGYLQAIGWPWVED